LAMGAAAAGLAMLIEQLIQKEWNG
jgi:hypothetical protein